MSWRYRAQRLPDGTWLDGDLPLTDVEVTTALSAPGGLTATVPVEVARLKGGPEAARAAMLSAAGKTNIIDSDRTPLPDTDALWVGPAGPMVFEPEPIDGGTVTGARTIAATSPQPGEEAALAVDGGGL